MIQRGEYAVFNDSGEVIPPGAAVEPTGQIDAQGRVKVRKPTADSVLSVLLNSLAKIDVDGVGLASSPYPACTFAVHLSDTPGDRAEVGTKAGDWYLRTGQKGFVCVGGFDAHRLMNAVPDPAAVGGASTSWYGIINSFFFNDSADLISFPSGFTRSTSLSGTTLPVVTDTVRFLFNTTSPTFGRSVAGVIVPQFSLFVRPVSGGTYGHFVVRAAVGGNNFGNWNTHNLGSLDYPSANGANNSHICGSPAIPFGSFIPAGQDFVDVTVHYAVHFYSNVNWGGAACPPMIFRACASGYAAWSDFLGNTTRGTARGSNGTPACPTIITI